MAGLRRAAGVLLAAVGLLLVTPPTAARPAATAGADVLVTEGGTRFALISCALRNTGAGWSVITDSGHTPSGCTGVVTHDAYLELLHPVGAVQVSSLTVTVDETYARTGLRAGVSAGFDHSYIYLYSGAAGSAALNPTSVVAASGNLWVQGYLVLPAI